MKSIRLLGLIVISGLFYFSEGKPCPEKTRAHKSRCDAYFKCILLPSKSHVWVPEKCEQGLIYEPNLQMCVLPGDDWECSLGDSNKKSDFGDDNVVYGVDADGLSGFLDTTKDSETKQDSDKKSESENNFDTDTKGVDYIAIESEPNLSDHEFESSGDGAGGADYIILDPDPSESKTTNEGIEISDTQKPSKIDPKLTAHLQRLTQLIDGLKQTYQSKVSASSDLRPDQLNAFLAHYNIKSQLDSLNPVQEENDSKINQQNLTSEEQSSTPTSTQLDPETKVVLTNQLPDGFANIKPTDGYSNSQIVVNKPEGSVLFALGNQPQDSIHDHRYDPKISEDTLKTVLELSKQMIENQNVRQVYPNSAYYPPLVQPIFLPPPVPQYANSIFNHHDGYEDKKYDKASSTYYVPQEKPDKPTTTIIHNNVIPVHVSSSSEDKQHTEQVDSYGQKLSAYPPLTNTDGESSNAQDHNLKNRYENNRLVTIRPNAGYQNYNNYQHQQDNAYNNYQYNKDYLPTTTSRPYISDSGSTLFDYYTPSPHLDETNVNNVFQVERYPTINYANIPSRPTYTQSNYNRNTPEISIFKPQKQQFPSYNQQNPYQDPYYPNQQSILQLFPSHIDVNKVKIRPNSQRLESMEQETAETYTSDVEDDNISTGIDTNIQPETYNRYNANKRIIASQLAQYVEQLNGNRPQLYPSAGNSDPMRNRLPTALSQNEDESQLNSLASNSLTSTYDFLNPKLSQAISLGSPTVDYNCPTGVRQPNTTDCTKYYVCSKEDRRAMQYSCPQYTAFNPQTRICDAQYYAICHPSAVISRFTVSENRRIQMEALKALQDAERIRNQAIQAQNLALRLRLGDANRVENEGSKLQQPPTASAVSQQYSSEYLSNILQNVIDSSSTLSANKGSSSNKNPPQMLSTIQQRPPTYSTPIATKKRKYYCKEGDKVADQTSIYNYFVCYKNAQGMMKGHKMTCSEGLLFCPMTTMCTLPRKCT